MTFAGVIPSAACHSEAKRGIPPHLSIRLESYLCGVAGIYIHIPFCRKACSYCNFHFSTLLKNKGDMLTSILREIELQQYFFPEKKPIETIYFGGGTPSLLSSNEINSILYKIQSHFTVTPNIEVTLEANPDDLTKDYIRELKDTSVNRLSIGVQSFFDVDLQYMNRAHNATAARQCLGDALNAGFHNLSVDLIYGTPTMPDNNWIQNLEAVFEFDIPHVSAYALTVEEDTALSNNIRKKTVQAPADEHTARQFEMLVHAMIRQGYLHYEISNFALPGKFAVHNSNYWKGVSYLGIGPSAHSFDGSRRYWNISNNALYAQKISSNVLPHESENLSASNRYNEYIMTSLRTMWGLDLQKIENDFGSSYADHFLKMVGRFLKDGFVAESHTVYTLTAAGKLMSDHITRELFID
jgi:oxygen-independent coproporphyrinogen-3 oxidase